LLYFRRRLPVDPGERFEVQFNHTRLFWRTYRLCSGCSPGALRASCHPSSVMADVPRTHFPAIRTAGGRAEMATQPFDRAQDKPCGLLAMTKGERAAGHPVVRVDVSRFYFPAIRHPNCRGEGWQAQPADISTGKAEAAPWSLRARPAKQAEVRQSLWAGAVLRACWGVEQGQTTFEPARLPRLNFPAIRTAGGRAEMATQPFDRAQDKPCGLLAKQGGGPRGTHPPWTGTSRTG
jgi:hypothetical protein